MERKLKNNIDKIIKKQKKELESKLKQVVDLGLTNPKEKKNRGISPKRFNVKCFNIKKLLFPSLTRHFRDDLNKKKLGIRALWANCKKNDIKRSKYKTLALVSFLRNTVSGEDFLKKTIYSLFTLPFIIKQKLYKKVVLSINDNNSDVILPKNTKLEIIEILIPRKNKNVDSIVSNMKILDKAKLKTWNTKFINLKTGLTDLKDSKLYYRTLANFEWITLSDLSDTDFTLPEKKYCFQKTIKKRVKKKISRDYMVFASKKEYDINKEPYKIFKLNEKGEVIAEFHRFYRLKVGGVYVGSIKAAANYIDLGTEHWGKGQGRFSKIKKGLGMLLRSIGRFSDKYYFNLFPRFGE